MLARFIVGDFGEFFRVPEQSHFLGVQSSLSILEMSRYELSLEIRGAEFDCCVIRLSLEWDAVTFVRKSSNFFFYQIREMWIVSFLSKPDVQKSLKVASTKIADNF